MKKALTAAAVVAVSAALMTAAPRDAKADGGVVAVGVAAYLVTDAIVGRECHLRTWPFNIIHKIGRELSGKPGCRHVHHRHHHHH
jgi:hypothetical protein